MDFDDLKRAWDDCDHELDTRIHLNARRLRSVLTRNADASANRLSHGEIDYTVPVVIVQKQLDTNKQPDTNWMVRMARNAASWLEKACRADEVAASFQTAVMRILRRHGTLRR
jgi:hypothetical protein